MVASGGNQRTFVTGTQEWYQPTQTWGLLRRSRSFKVTDFGTNQKHICNDLLVTNSNLPPILQRFRDTAFEMSKITIFGYPSCVQPPMKVFHWYDLNKILPGCQRMVKVPNGVETLQKISTG